MKYVCLNCYKCYWGPIPSLVCIHCQNNAFSPMLRGSLTGESAQS